MSLSLLIGIVFGFYILEQAIGLDQVLQLFYQVDALWIVFGGTFAATLATYPLKNMLKIPFLLFKAFSLPSLFLSKYLLSNELLMECLFLVHLVQNVFDDQQKLHLV